MPAQLFNRPGPILVSLDGSARSEAAIPQAVALARVLDARILLVGVVDLSKLPLLPEPMPPQISQETLDTLQEQLQGYLSGAAARVRRSRVDVRREARHGVPAEEILRAVADHGARAVVMATRGQGGLRRLLLGSVAHEVMQRAPVPTVLVPASGPTRRAVVFRCVLVPLDGSPLAEQALDTAAELVRRVPRGELHLVRVVPPALQYYPIAVPGAEAYIPHLADDAALEEAANRYLAGMASRFRGAHVTARTLRGDPADEIARYARERRINLILMTTHGRTGVARFLVGSVADRLTRVSSVPVALLRAQAAGAAAPEEAAAPGAGDPGHYCFNCGRPSSYREPGPDDRCIRCGYHLHTCGNCVYYDGARCQLDRPEARETYPGTHCPEFRFRETPGPPPRPRRAALRS